MPKNSQSALYASGVGIDVMSVEEITKKIKGFDAASMRVWKKVAKKELAPAINRVRQNAPVASGLLKKAITGKVNHYGNLRIYLNPRVYASKVNGKFQAKVAKGAAKSRKSWKERGMLEGRIRRPFFYGVPLEMGQFSRRKVAPRPFMLGVFDGREAEIRARIVREFDAEIAKMSTK